MSDPPASTSGGARMSFVAPNIHDPSYDMYAAVMSGNPTGGQKAPKFGTNLPFARQVEQAQAVPSPALSAANAPDEAQRAELGTHSVVSAPLPPSYGAPASLDVPVAKDPDDKKKTPKFGTNLPTNARASFQGRSVDVPRHDTTVLEETIEEARTLSSPVVANVPQDVVLTALPSTVGNPKITPGYSMTDLGPTTSMSNLVDTMGSQSAIMTALDVRRVEQARDVMRKKQRSKMEGNRRRRMIFMCIFLAVAILIIAAITAILLMQFFRQPQQS
ncbi:hypothetical protein M427DRAFT_67551 [Gonapodya prolifera JEL478]|uniref:Uncharacterized protein n=1 Tax=Gonapodya prolifera (strain JEL478) TaxID=1344416 RepID=A0A139AQE6_GONPJ|nr:hypothetical protein M427DRAFT_67551 [Gonapodya prolifera JEL478]|eukprot:KXS18977.1 hypothetical protein M427DRAFT_67551 [Gonapodya prolifera JEL478]